MKQNFAYLKCFGISLVLSLTVGCVKLQKSGSETQTAPNPVSPQGEHEDPTVSPPTVQNSTQAAPSIPSQISPGPVEPPPETRLVIEGNIVLDVKTVMQLGAIIKKDGTNEIYAIRVDNLIFKNQAVLKTEGLNLEIESKSLFVDGKAQLMTFAAGEKADLNKPGRSGGRIVIRTRYAEGELNFILNGENGGDGLTGAAPGPEKNGSTGANGADGLVDLKQYTFSIGGTHDSNNWFPNCQTAPSLGALGSSGLQGNQGLNGRAGGDSGELVFRALDRQNFSFFILEQSPGFGGQGGEGGAGGQPGAQGQRGVILTSPEFKKSIYANISRSELALYCGPLLESDEAKPTAGAQGPRGNTGPSGELKKNSF